MYVHYFQDGQKNIYCDSRRDIRRVIRGVYDLFERLCNAGEIFKFYQEGGQLEFFVVFSDGTPTTAHYVPNVAYSKKTMQEIEDFLRSYFSTITDSPLRNSCFVSFQYNDTTYIWDSASAN